MKIDRNKKTIETNGKLNSVARVMRRLGFSIVSRRGLSARSETYRGYFSVCDRLGREWHVIG